MANQALNGLDIEKIVKDCLDSIEREREQEIIKRRFGLFDRRETLEQIGELLGITRERVRQLEKAVVTKLKASSLEGSLPQVDKFQAACAALLNTKGQIARVSDLAAELTDENSREDQARVGFLGSLSPKLVVVDENDNFFHAIATNKIQDEKTIQKLVDRIISAVKEIGEPAEIEKIAERAGIKDVKHAKALASISKQLATLNEVWGLIKWPLVNPKNIRDKIYVILRAHGKHMHFGEISDAIKKSDFKRKDVTTQAIHNELIKDKRFVLVGRGIYALKEWGYKRGTVADVISDVLKKAGEPLHRDEIVKRVLKSRYVKETTILLNLQGKPQFKRAAKATYTLAE